MGYRVLLADIDPQGNSTSGFGVNKREISLSSYEIITSQAAIEDAILKTDCENVYILPSNMNLAGAEIEIIEVEKRESILKTALLKVSDKFDYIFIDCPPSLGLLTLNALCASDTFLVPIQCEYYALEGLSQLMSTVRQVKRRYNPILSWSRCS